MDELRSQLGAAVAHLQAALPNPNAWSGAAALALTQRIDEISREVGHLILDAFDFLEPLQIDLNA